MFSSKRYYGRCFAEIISIISLHILTRFLYIKRFLIFLKLSAVRKSHPKGAITLDGFWDRHNFNRPSAKTVGVGNTLIGPGGSHVDKEVRKNQ